MPEIARAEAMAWPEKVWELIYKQRATLKGNYPPKPGLGPLALLPLESPSLTPPCYMSPPPSNATGMVASSFENVFKVGMGIIDQMQGILIPDEAIMQCHSGTGWSVQGDVKSKSMQLVGPR